MCALVLACVLAGVALEPADDVRARLDKAIAAHRMAMDKACNDIDDALSSKIELFRKQGDREGLKRVKAELEAWQSTRKLPRSVPTALYQVNIDKTTKTLTLEFDRALREFTKLGRDDLADVAEKERGDLLKAGKPAETTQPAIDAKMWYSIQAAKSQRYAAAAGGTSATPDIGFVDKPDDTPAHWQMTGSADGVVRIVNRKTSKILTPALVQATSGTDVVLKGPLKTVGHQGWRVIPAEPGLVRLRHERTGRFLSTAADGKGLALADDAKSPDSLWKILRLP